MMRRSGLQLPLAQEFIKSEIFYLDYKIYWPIIIFYRSPFESRMDVILWAAKGYETGENNVASVWELGRVSYTQSKVGICGWWLGVEGIVAGGHGGRSRSGWPYGPCNDGNLAKLGGVCRYAGNGQYIHQCVSLICRADGNGRIDDHVGQLFAGWLFVCFLLGRFGRIQFRLGRTGRPLRCGKKGGCNDLLPLYRNV